MLEIKNLSKSYSSHKVLSSINLKIEDNDIYGILGLSGAGKSTLVRCLNGLEDIDEGEIYLDNKLLISKNKKISKDDLKNISMIFQSFNLLNQKNVINNVELGLKLQGKKIKYSKIELKKLKKELKLNKNNIKDYKNYKKRKILELKHKEAFECLKKVGLEDKYNAYPSELSGGQKQRVAIARSLITKPSILLCDEATSALDIETTNQILDLLKKLHDEYSLTIIVIAHQLQVIEKICNKVAIIDNSLIVEQGNLKDVFFNPKSEIAKSLIYSSHINTSLSNDHSIRLLFDGNSDEPIIFDIIEKCNIKVSILHADTKIIDNKVYGQLVFKLPDNDSDKNKLIDYLNYKNIKYEEIDN